MGKNENIFPTINKKIRVSPPSTLFYYSTQTLNQTSKARERSKSDTNKKGTGQNIPI
jgi:hypothetical protein